MKILKYLLIIVVLVALYITYPIWKLTPRVTVSEVQNIDEPISETKDKRKNLDIEATAQIELEDKIGPMPSVAYQSRVPRPLQRYWDETLNENESIYEEICSRLKATKDGWTTTCQFKIKRGKGISTLRFETYTIKNGEVIKQ